MHVESTTPTNTGVSLKNIAPEDMLGIQMETRKQKVEIAVLKQKLQAEEENAKALINMQGKGYHLNETA